MKRVVFLIGVCLFIWVGSAFALPTLDLGYTWTTSSYWTPTDLTTADEGSIYSVDFGENASYDASFGIFTVDDLANPTSITTKYQIFSNSDETLADQNVYFKHESSSWYVSPDTTSWTLFDNVFGFYFDIYTGGEEDTTYEYSYYSDNQFNDPSSEVGIDHILMAFNGIDNVKLYLDDQIDLLPADKDFNDMIVKVTDVAPVPEPATLLLLGSGLVGLAFLKRRKS